MLTSVLVVAQQVLMLFLVMSVGFVCRRIRFLDDKSVKGMIDLLMMVVTPCLIVHIFERPFEPSMVKGLGLAFVAALFAHAVAAVFAALCLRVSECCGSRFSFPTLATWAFRSKWRC